MLHGVFYIEDDEEGDMQKKVPCTGPAQTRGQRYCSGSVYVTKQYRFDEGGPTAEAVLLALVAYGRELREKAMQKTEEAALSAQHHREGRRALFMLPFLAQLPRQGEVKGEVQLEEILGEGGSGVVRHAFINGREAAAKLPVSTEPEYMESLEREIAIMRSKQLLQLQGLAVVPLIAAGTAGGLPFLATQLMGPSAAEAPPLSAKQEAAAISGLMRMHAAGVLHGDARPENLLLPRDDVEAGVPMWADLGKATFSNDRREHDAEVADCKRLLAMQRGRSVLRHLSKRPRPPVQSSFPRAAWRAAPVLR